MTPEMEIAGKDAVRAAIAALPDDVRLPGHRAIKNIQRTQQVYRWRAMLAASPLTPGEKGEGR